MLIYRVFLLYRKVRPIKQNAPRGCAQMRKEYCCKRRATRIWHTKWSKSLMNEGFRELMWTCPLCSFIGLGCQKLVFFLALVKLHNLRLRFVDGVCVSQAPQTRRFRPFCSVAYQQMFPQTRYAQTVLQHLRLLTKLGKNLLSSACVCLARTPSANCYLIVVQFRLCAFDTLTFIG